MRNVSVQLAGKLINGLPSKWSTGESMGCGQATGNTVQSPRLLGCAHTPHLRGAVPVAFPCTHPNHTMRHLGQHSEMHLNPHTIKRSH